MNIKNIADTYQALGEISDYGPDIFGSEDSRDCLEKAGVPKQNAVSALLSMQLEQERLSRIPALQPSSYSAEESLSMARQSVVFELRDQLAPYTQEQQRGICLFMLENIDSMLQYTGTERQRLQWARLTMEQLMELTAEKILRCAGRLLEENEQQLSRFEEDIQTGRTTLSPLGSHSAAAAAAAVAIYAECPEYRDRPEWVAEGAYMLQDDWTEKIDFIALILFMMSAVLLLSILFSCAVTSVGVSLYALYEMGGLSVAMIAEEFIAALSCFKVVLLIAGGLGVASLVISGVAQLVRMLHKDSQAAEAAQQDASSEKEEDAICSASQAMEGEEEEDDDPDEDSVREHQRA